MASTGYRQSAHKTSIISKVIQFPPCPYASLSLSLGDTVFCKLGWGEGQGTPPGQDPTQLPPLGWSPHPFPLLHQQRWQRALADAEGLCSSRRKPTTRGRAWFLDSPWLPWRCLQITEAAHLPVTFPVTQVNSSRKLSDCSSYKQLNSKFQAFPL